MGRKVSIVRALPLRIIQKIFTQFQSFIEFCAISQSRTILFWPFCSRIAVQFLTICCVLVFVLTTRLYSQLSCLDSLETLQRLMTSMIHNFQEELELSQTTIVHVSRTFLSVQNLLLDNSCNSVGCLGLV